jgi:hypothetical protein
MFVLNCLATDCSLLPATSQDMFGKKVIFSSKMEIIDGCEGLNSSHGSSTQNSFPFFVSSFTLTNEQILDIMCGWITSLFCQPVSE